MGITACGVLFLAGFGAKAAYEYVAPLATDTTPASIQAEGKAYVVSDESGERRLRFAWGEPAELSVRVYQADKHSGSFQEGGISFELAYLSAEDHALFVRQFGHGGYCPAPFYNAHRQHLFIISDRKELLEQLRSCSFQRWENVRISGIYLDFAAGSSPTGRLALPTGNFRYLYPHKVEFENANCNTSAIRASVEEVTRGQAISRDS